MKKIMQNKKLILFLKIVLIILGSLLLELTVFNYRHYLTLFYKPQKIEATITADETYPYYIIETDELNEDIKNIYVVTDSSYEVVDEMELFSRDESSNLYISQGKIAYSYYSERSKYIYPSFEGKCIQFKLKISSKEQITKKTTTLIINKKVPIIFSGLRFILMIIIGLLVLFFNPKSKIYKTKLLSEYTTLYLCGLILFELLSITLIYFSGDNLITRNEYNELTTAIVDQGKTYVAENDSNIIKSMENPYDYPLRRLLFDSAYSVDGTGEQVLEEYNITTTANEKFQWDHALYKDKYYIYFGIGPVLLTYIPLKVLFDYTLNTKTVIYFMLILTVIVYVIFMYLLCRKYFKNINAGLFLILTFVSMNSVGIISMMAKCTFYAIPYVYSLFLAISGLTLIIHSYDKNKWYSYLELAIAYFMLAFTCLTRPTYLITLIITLPFLINRLFKNKDIKIKHKIITLLVCAIPVVLVAAGCMWYNYIRFDNVFEFGAKYQMTLKDVYHQEFNINKVWLAIQYYFLMPPTVIGKFPYFTYDVFNNNYLGVTVVEYMFGGAFPTHLLLIFGLLIFKMRKKVNKELYWTSILCLISAVVVAVFENLEAGLIYRYFYDFMYLLVIPSTIVILSLYENKNKADKDKLLKVVLFCSVLTMLFEILTLFTGESILSSVNNPTIYYAFYYLLFP